MCDLKTLPGRPYQPKTRLLLWPQCASECAHACRAAPAAQLQVASSPGPLMPHLLPQAHSCRVLGADWGQGRQPPRVRQEQLHSHQTCHSLQRSSSSNNHRRPAAVHQKGQHAQKQPTKLPCGPVATAGFVGLSITAALGYDTPMGTTLPCDQPFIHANIRPGATYLIPRTLSSTAKTSVIAAPAATTSCLVAVNSNSPAGTHLSSPWPTSVARARS